MSMASKNKKDCTKLKFIKTVSWQVCNVSESKQPQYSLVCRIDAAHYHNYRKKQREQIKELEEQVLKTRKQRDELQEKLSLKDQRCKQKTYISKLIFDRPDLIVKLVPSSPASQNNLNNNVNNLQTKDPSSGRGSSHNDSSNVLNRNSIICSSVHNDIKDIVQEESKTINKEISIETDKNINYKREENTLLQNKEENPEKEIKSKLISTEKKNKVKKKIKDVDEENFRRQKKENYVKEKPENKIKSKFIKTDEKNKVKIEIKDGDEEKTQNQKTEKHRKKKQKKERKSHSNKKKRKKKVKIKIKDDKEKKSQQRKTKENKNRKGKYEVKAEIKEENSELQKIIEDKKENCQTLVAESLTQPDCVIDMESTPASTGYTPDRATKTSHPHPEHVASSTVNNMFQAVPNADAAKCLESFSTWPNFSYHTETGRRYRAWFQSSATVSQKTGTRGCKRKISASDEFIDLETFHDFRQMRAAPEQFLPSTSSVPMAPPSLSPHPVIMLPPQCSVPIRNPVPNQHPNFNPPVFPTPPASPSTPREIPITPMVPSGSPRVSDVRPRFASGSHNTLRSRNTPYPPQRTRVTRSTGRYTQPETQPDQRYNQHTTQRPEQRYP